MVAQTQEIIQTTRKVVDEAKAAHDAGAKRKKNRSKR
jgi:hypothetical protein